MIKKIKKKINEWLSEPTETWVLSAKTYAPPVNDSRVTTITDSKVLERALFGVTSFMYKCLETNEVRIEQVLGSDQTQLKELTDKVEKFGMQYFKEGEKVYAITRWIPDNTIPLKK